MIRTEALTMTYPGNEVLQGADVTIAAGEFVFLKGESGSGKSTLLKILYRELDRYEGKVYLDGSDLREQPKYVSRRIVGTIFQTFELLDRKTALENVMLAGEVLGRPEKEIREAAIQLLARVGLSGKEDRFPHQLSGGEQQRVAIARALLNKPKVLLADEPTGNLDTKNAFNVMQLLADIHREEGMTMLLVTHSDELVRQFPARTLTMVDGRVTE